MHNYIQFLPFSPALFVLQTRESLVVTFGICHILGMTSVVANPILYAALNTNFSKVQMLIRVDVLEIFDFFFSYFSPDICRENNISNDGECCHKEVNKNIYLQN